MKAKNVALIVLVALFAVSPVLYAESRESADERPYIGVQLDPRPLGDLLVKHLGLSPNQGIRIKNVNRDTPADNAGLERDDIIIGFQGKDVTDVDKFVEAVRASGVGKEVSLEIIHLGERKTVQLRLERFKEEFDWKYSPEPDIVQSWQPGKMFRLQPGDKEWIEIPFADIPGRIELYLKGLSKDGAVGFLKEVYLYHYSEEGQTYTIAIEGDPDDRDTKITVRVGDTEYRTTVKEIDKLPKKYRSSTEEALEHARKSAKERKTERRLYTRRYYVPSPPEPEAWKRYYDYEKWAWPRYRPAPPFGPGEDMFDKIEKQMRELRGRLEELEKRHREMRERFSDEQNRKESKEQQKKEEQKV